MEENIRELQMEKPEKDYLEKDALILKDVVLPFDGYERYYVVENMEKSELLSQLKDYYTLHPWGSDICMEDFLEGRGAKLTLWYDSYGFAVQYPVDFFDVVDNDGKIWDAERLLVTEQAAMLIKREEYAEKVFDQQDRDVLMDYASKIDDIEKVKTYIRHLAMAYRNDDYAAPPGQIIECMQEEIDKLSEQSIGDKEMYEAGSHDDPFLLLTKEKAADKVRNNTRPQKILAHGEKKKSVLKLLHERQAKIKSQKKRDQRQKSVSASKRKRKEL